jgi:NADH-quinone oxidoreductase subunit N
VTAAALDRVPALDWVALAPVVAPVVGLLLVLAVDAVRPAGRSGERGGPAGRWPRLVADLVACGSLLAAGVAVAWLAADGGIRSTACVPGSGAALPACSYTVSGLTLALQGLVVGAALVCLLLALGGPGAQDRGVHHSLLLAATAGALAVAGARDLATLVVAFETASLPVVGLVALRRDAQGAQAAVSFLLTAVGSLAVLLLGVAMIYAATGSLHLDGIATALSDPGSAGPGSAGLPDGGGAVRQVRAVAGVGALLAAAGIGFKLSAVPFHLWTPDTYAGAPLPVAAFLSVVSKAAGAAALVVLVGIGLPALAGIWAPALAVVAVLTMTVGNLVALGQRVAVRLLAWSTVAQAGWVLLPLAAAGSGTPGAVRAAVTASVGYLVAYSVAGLAAFAVVVLLARHHPAGEEHTLEAYRGLARREPVAAAVLGFALACLAGLPPGIMGLVAKVVAVRPVVDAGVWPVAVAAAVNLILGLAYYVRWAGLLVGRPEVEPPTWRVSIPEGMALGAAAASCLALSGLGQVIAAVIPGSLR